MSGWSFIEEVPVQLYSKFFDTLIEMEKMNLAHFSCLCVSNNDFIRLILLFRLRLKAGSRLSCQSR